MVIKKVHFYNYKKEKTNIIIFIIKKINKLFIIKEKQVFIIKEKQVFYNYKKTISYN